MLLSKFFIIGLSCITANNGQADKDIPALWGKLFEKNVAELIENKVDEDAYAVYSDYDGNETDPYKITIGYRVSDLNSIPEGLDVITIEEQNYDKFVATGDITKQVENPVYMKWVDIWNTDLDRTYRTDFEVYKEGMDPSNATVEIYVGTKK